MYANNVNIQFGDIMPECQYGSKKGKKLHQYLLKRYGTITRASEELHKSRVTIYNYIWRGVWPEWLPKLKGAKT